MASTVAPIFFLVEKSTKCFSNYKQRSIERSDPNTELQILTCIHSTRNVSGIINLLQLSNATTRSPICVFAVHLVQLTGTGRASAMLIVQDSRKTRTIIGNGKNNNDITPQRAESEQIVDAFGNFERENETAVTVHPLTAVSAYTTIHEEIFQLAEEKHVAFILVPYHKLPTANGRLQGDNVSIRQLNQNLLNNAPCCIGILVDRGVGPPIEQNSTEFDKSEFRIAMLFIGGPDDHEALSYASRMAQKSGVTLTVVRFLEAKEENTRNECDLEDMTESEEGKEIDDDFINEFRQLSEWRNSLELGAIGETLITTQATGHASVLVVQQSAIGQLGTGTQRRKAQFGEKNCALNPDYEAYARTYNL
ncbi:hypothetical protein Patl1_30626 [Pistacia atlantica]|uniref:Uncharacterized protein n=1 Tax=Pistacia atlantica TaxID=434234 RepID=A0ACC1ACD4_9ROSI|nr:hypothetical protein Patl1_30626 [Pistacia atlantica]